MSTETEIGRVAVAVVSATLLGFMAKEFDMPPMIAYVVTGALIGPLGFSILRSGSLTQTASELGLSFLLFFIGMEIELEQIREVIRPSVIIAAFNLVFVGIIGYLVALYLGFGPSALIIGIAFSFSSTAVVVKLLTDNDNISTLPGKLDIGILLFQDLIVVFVLSALTSGLSDPTGLALHLMEVLLIASLIAFTSLTAGRQILNRWFQKISESEHVLFVHGIAWLFAAIIVSGEIGISTEIGSFLAGLSIAQIPYSAELKEKVRPLTDLFMAVFFVNIGLQLQPEAAQLLNEALIAVAILIPVKFAGFFSLTDRLRFTPETSFKTSLNLVQVSEFGLIMSAVALSEGFIGTPVMNFITLTAVISMAISSYLISSSSEMFELSKPFLARLRSDQKNDFEVDKLQDHALIVGYDEIGRNLARALEEQFEKIVIVDRNSDNVQELAESGYEFIFGDFKHGEIRNAAGLKDASIVISLSPEQSTNMITLEEAEDATLFVKSENVEDAAELYDLGAHYVIIKHDLSSDKLIEYIELWREKPELFKKEVERYRNSLEEER